MSRVERPTHLPTTQEVQTARAEFRRREPRDLFYTVASELIALALEGRTKISVVEALAVLLQTWNVSFYRFHGKFSEKHFNDIEEVYGKHQQDIAAFRSRSIADLTAADEGLLKRVFGDFAGVLGPVGSAKALHLLAPDFFPLWDNKIAAGYGLPLGASRQRADCYYRFMLVAKQQVEALVRESPAITDPLKAIDEYNYCTFTLGKDTTYAKAVEPAREWEGTVDTFIDDDKGFLDWIASHPAGYVLNTYRKPTPGYLKLHLASCRNLTPDDQRHKEITKDYPKRCSLDTRSLQEWADQEFRRHVELSPCGICKPTGNAL